MRVSRYRGLVFERENKVRQARHVELPQLSIKVWIASINILTLVKLAPWSESKVISLEERAKVTEALKAILDKGGSRLSETDIVRLKAGWETQSCEVGLTPAPLVICPAHTIFYKRRSEPYRA